jgi:hypothetical protein
MCEEGEDKNRGNVKEKGRKGKFGKQKRKTRGKKMGK